MRKNILKVIDAYKQRKAAKGDSKASCSTDGERIYSYYTMIAKRKEDGFTHIVDNSGWSRTTMMQIRALESELGRHCGHDECKENAEMSALCPYNRKLVRT